jgi:multidrug transporter EmrE-like cation transporter
MLLAKYKDVLGTPKVGFHAARIPILDYALWDTVGTLVITLALVYFFAKDKSWQNTLRWVIFAFGLGLILHVLFGVRTTMTQSLVGV